MLRRSIALPLLVGISTLSFALVRMPAAVSQPAAAENAEAPADGFAAISAAMRDNNLTEAARLLKLMQAAGLKPDQRTRWNTFASRVAVRQGDLKWLREINNNGQLHETANDLLILNAMRFLLAAQLDDARQLLKQVKEPENLAEIPRRRYLELWARLEQLSGNQAEERKWIEQLVNFISEWDQPHCQMCHANPKQYGQEVTTFDVSDWWVGERYSKLLQQAGIAKTVADEAAATLAKNQRDGPARMRQAYALRSLGDEAGAVKNLRSFSWAEFPDRPVKKPLRLATFP